MDYIEGLPKSGSANCILVIVDKFTRYGHFVALSHPYTASSIAMVFMTEVYRLHRMLASIISDRDLIFTSVQLCRNSAENELIITSVIG
jgi:hypothetical protein